MWQFYLRINLVAEAFCGVRSVWASQSKRLSWCFSASWRSNHLRMDVMLSQFDCGLSKAGRYQVHGNEVEIKPSKPNDEFLKWWRIYLNGISIRNEAIAMELLKQIRNISSKPKIHFDENLFLEMPHFASIMNSCLLPSVFFLLSSLPCQLPAYTFNRHNSSPWWSHKNDLSLSEQLREHSPFRIFVTERIQSNCWNSTGKQLIIIRWKSIWSVSQKMLKVKIITSIASNICVELQKHVEGCLENFITEVHKHSWELWLCVCVAACVAMCVLVCMYRYVWMACEGLENVFCL